MFDVICILCLYFVFMLNLLGIEIFFIFKVATVISIANLSINVIKLIQGRSIHNTNNMPRFWENTFKIVICVTSSMICLMFTAFASWKIKLIFIGFFSILMTVAFVLKESHFKVTVLVLLTSAYGIILAKWYQANPLEGRFGDNSFLESIGIVLSSVILLFSTYVLTKNRVNSEE